MPLFWKGKKVILCGGSKGIGKEIALMLANFDCTFVISGRHEDTLNDVAEKCNNIIALRKGTGKCSIVVTDQEDLDKCSEFVKKCVDILKEIDIVIYNAAKQQFRPFDTYSQTESINELKSIMNTNFFSFVIYYRGFLPYLRKTHGTITVVSSGAGKMGSQFSSFYAASKAALNEFMNSVRKETQTNPGDDDHVNRCVVLSGLTETEPVLNSLAHLEGTKILTPTQVARRILEITMCGSWEEGTDLLVTFAVKVVGLIPKVINYFSLKYLPSRKVLMDKNPDWKDTITI